MKPGFYRFSLDYGNLEHLTWQLATDEGEALELYLYEMPQVGRKMRFNEFRAGVLKINNSGKHRITITPLNIPPEKKVEFSLREIIIEPFKI